MTHNRHANLLALLFLLLIASVLFFWRLGEGSLQTWDEAWYGSISRNVQFEHNPWKLTFNAKPFFDHPPLGFQLKALSMRLLGESTFSVRLPEALAGLVSLVLVFLIGKRVSSPWAGFWSGILLLFSRWFLFRARSGNLDVLLVTTQLAVLLLVIEVFFAEVKRASKQNNLQFFLAHARLWLLWFALSLSLLAKSVISLQLLPLAVLVSVLYWRRLHQPVFSFATAKVLLICLVALFLPMAPWIITALTTDASGFFATQLRVGLRGGTEKGINFAFVRQTLDYFHAAVHRWYSLMVGSFVGTVALLFYNKSRAAALLLLAYCALVAAPYLVSEKTEIWHLIPLVGAFCVLTGVFLDMSIVAGTTLLLPTVKRIFDFVSANLSILLMRLLVTITVLALAAFAARDYWAEFLSVPIYPSDYEKIMSHLSSKKTNLYVTSDANFPALIYYANLQDAQVVYLSDTQDGAVCNQAIVANEDLQIVAFFGDWVMSRTSDRYVTAREGGLVLLELSPNDCREYLRSRGIPVVTQTIQTTQ